jgi:hypothetical protein
MSLFSKKKQPFKQLVVGEFTYKLWFNEKEPTKARVEVESQGADGFGFKLPISMSSCCTLVQCIMSEGCEDILKNYAMMMYSTASLMLTDEEFTADVVKSVNKWSGKMDKLAEKAAAEVTENDELMSQAFMETLTEPLEEDEKARRAELKELLEGTSW